LKVRNPNPGKTKQKPEECKHCRQGTKEEKRALRSRDVTKRNALDKKKKKKVKKNWGGQTLLGASKFNQV